MPDIGAFARLDFDRDRRTGFGETVYGPGKTAGQLAEIFAAFRRRGRSVLATRVSAEQAAALAERLPGVCYDPVSRTLASAWRTRRPAPELPGTAAVLAAGTADLPVAEEAAKTVEFFGGRVERFYDVGIAGLHRLLGVIGKVRKADVVIAAAGMEGALPSVVAGLVSAPVIALPTSVGYGCGAGGVAAVLSMLSSCAEGVTVVNIDNGFGAAVAACRILRNRARSKPLQLPRGAR